MAHVRALAEVLREGETDARGGHPPIDEPFGRVHAAVAAEDDECPGVERDRGRQNPADRAHDDSGISNSGEQLAHRQLASCQRHVVRRQRPAIDPFVVVLDVANDDDGEAATFQVAGDLMDVFGKRVPGLVVPFHPPHHRSDDRQRCTASVERAAAHVW